MNSDTFDTELTAAVAAEQPDDLVERRRRLLLQMMEEEDAQQSQQTRGGFWRSLRDMGGAIATLPAEIPRRVVAATQDIGEELAVQTMAPITGRSREELRQQLASQRTGLERAIQTPVYQPDTTAGEVTQELGSFVGGAALLQRATGALSWAARAPTMVGRLGRGAAIGAPLDLTMTDTGDDNLSRLFTDLGGSTFLTDLLATDPDDAAIERRIKAVGEGAVVGSVIGLAIEPLARAAVGIRRALRPAAQREAEGAPRVADAAVTGDPAQPFERFRRAEGADENLGVADTAAREPGYREAWEGVAEGERGNINAAVDKLGSVRSYGEMERALNGGVAEVEAAAREIALRQNILDNLRIAEGTFEPLRVGRETDAAFRAQGDANWTARVPGEHPLMEEAVQAANGRGEGWDAARAREVPLNPQAAPIEGDPGRDAMARMIADAEADLREARGAYEALMQRNILTADEKAALERAIKAATPKSPDAPATAPRVAQGATPDAPAGAAPATAAATPAPGTTAAARVFQMAPDAARALRMDEAQAQRVVDLLKEGRATEAADLIEINPVHVQGREGIVSVLNALHDQFAPAFASANQRVKSEAVTVGLADAIASTPERARAALARAFGNTRDLDAVAVLAKRYMTSSAQSVLDLAKRYHAGDASVRGELIAAVGRAKEAREFFEGTASSFGRALRALQIDADAMARLAPDDLSALVAEAGGSEAVDKFAARVAMMQHPEQIARMMKGTGWDRFMAATEELFINNILSGPITQTINLTSSALNVLVSPLRHTMGGAWRGDWSAVKGGVAMYHALGESFFDHIRLMRLAAQGRDGWSEIGKTYANAGTKPELLNGVRAFLDDAPVLDREAFQRGIDMHGRGNAISGAAFNLSGASAAVVDVFGKAVRMPTRLMMSADEIVRGVAYRMDIRRMAVEEGLEKVRNGTLPEADLGAFVARAVADPSAEMHNLALQSAREATFSQHLDRHGRLLDRIGTRVSDMVQAVPPLRFVLPFVTTPTNLLKWFADHSVVAPAMTRRFWREVRGMEGDMAQRLAFGRLSMGMMLWGAASYAASTGSMIGAIPNGNGGAAERASGALPYSVKVGDSFVPFGRFDPIAMHFGVAADIAQMFGRVDARTQEGLVMGYITAVAQNLFNKTYFKGVSDLFSAVNDPFASDLNPGERMTRFLSNTAAALVPFSGLQRSIARDLDPVQREVRVHGGDDEWPSLQRLVNQVMANTPGLSDNLPPVRDLRGDPVQVPVGWGSQTLGAFAMLSPLQYRDEAQSPFLRELRRLGYDMQPLVPWTNSDGIRMAPQQRDRLILLTTQGVEIGGRTLAEALDALVQSPLYQQSTDDGRDGSGGGKRDLIQRVVRRYRTMGEMALAQEDPEWGAQVREQRIQRRVQRIPGILAGTDQGDE